MARRRASEGSGSFAFPLVPDDEPSPGSPLPPEGPGALAELFGRIGARLRAMPRRRLVATGLVLAVLAAGGVATNLALQTMSRERTDALLVTAPGGVVGLDHVPAVVWRDAAVRPRPIAVMDGLLVVASDRTGGLTVQALDPQDGAPRWTVLVDDAYTCGEGVPVPGREVSAVAELVCVTGVNQTGVVVIDGHGKIVAQRALAGRTASGTVAVAPGGALLRVDRVGPESPAPQLRDGVISGPLVTRDARVRLEDAVTGATRWVATVAGGSAPAGTSGDGLGQCQNVAGDDGAVTVEPEGGWAINMGARRVWVSACGLDATFDLATGDVVLTREAFAPQELPYSPAVTELDAGGYAIQATGDQRPVGAVDTVTMVYSGAGRFVGDVDGVVAPVSVNDGSPTDLMLTTGSAGFSAYDAADAHLVWKRAVDDVGYPVARTRHVVVAVKGAGLVGLDAATGRSLWTNPLWQQRPGAQNGIGASGLIKVVTDGERVVLFETEDGSWSSNLPFAVTMTALDVATGATLWTARTTEVLPESVGGHLYRFEQDAVVALG